MCTQSDFVFSSIYRGSLKVGASRLVAEEKAKEGLEKYKKSMFAKPSKLIMEMIAAAKKDRKK